MEHKIIDLSFTANRPHSQKDNYNEFHIYCILMVFTHNDALLDGGGEGHR